LARGLEERRWRPITANYDLRLAMGYQQLHARALEDRAEQSRKLSL
jgi:hypothetical protein